MCTVSYDLELYLLSSVNYKLCTVYCMPGTNNYVVCTVYYKLSTIYGELYIVYFVLLTTNYGL